MKIKERDAGDALKATHTSSDIKASISPTEWRRFDYSVVMGHADCSVVRVSIEVTHAGSGSIDLQIAGAQVEQAAYPSSLIPTTSAAVTRNAEALSYPTASNFVGGTDGSICLAFRPIMLPDEQGGVGYKDYFYVNIDGDNWWKLYHNGNANKNANFYVRYAGTDKVAYSSADPWTVRYSLHSQIGTYSTTADASSKKLNNYIDGLLDGTNADYVVPTGSLPALFQIQGNSNQAMILTGIALFNKRLDSTQAAKVDGVLT